MDPINQGKLTWIMDQIIHLDHKSIIRLIMQK